MKGKDTTVAELMARLAKCKPTDVVRVAVTHDLDVDLCQQGPIVDMRKRKGVVILEASDDCSHGFGKV